MKSSCGLSILSIALALCACASAESQGESRVVKLRQGPVRGYRDPEFDLYTFYNLPYATAPQGKDRFKAPLPPPTWTSVRDAVDKQVTCPQSDMNGYLVNKTLTPDCLIANVYVPDTEEKNLRVMVVVHGGAYQMGNGELATAKHFLKGKKIIVVTFNYRVGPHGFLCLGTPDAPGNAGMKDQVALLRWVRDNIATFGGNPNDVTIEGYSAGSSAVDLLLLSKSAQGLFHKAIPESGANLASWSVQVDPIANAKEYAMKIGFTNVDDFYALEEFYKTVSFETLNKESFFNRLDNNFVFTPCVERDTGVERFLDDAPINILKSGKYSKVPLLYGFANMEGLFRVNFNYEAFKNGMNKKFSNFLPHDLQFESEEEKEKVAKRVKEFYFGDKPVGDDTILQYINYYTDVIFAYATLRSVKLQVEAGNNQIYLYEYSFAYKDNPMPPGVSAVVRGADHCAQSAAFFDGQSLVVTPDENTLNEDLKEMKAIVREIWYNFITTGTPVPEGSSLPQWPAVSAARSPYMELTLPPRLHGAMYPERARLWDDIYAKYHRVPTAPPTPPSKRTDL